MRKEFRDLSGVMIDLARHAGSSGKQPLLVYHCPMAFNNEGADWMQNKSGTENPYFGSKMFNCGTEEGNLTHGGRHNE
jgi:Cu(I)/Ag(I) efflux system membrane fusion protein